MMYADFATLGAFDDFRDALWVAWHADRSAELAASYPERGHVIGGALDWQPPRSPNPRTGMVYPVRHSRAGQPMPADPGRAGGLVWVTTTAPGCRDDRLIPHVDGLGGGVLPMAEDLLALLSRYEGRQVSLPTTSALDAAANPRALPKPGGALSPTLRATRVVALQRENERRARLLLGHRINGVQLARSRVVMIPGQTVAFERVALSARARATLEDFESNGGRV